MPPLVTDDAVKALRTSSVPAETLTLPTVRGPFWITVPSPAFVSAALPVSVPLSVNSALAAVVIVCAPPNAMLTAIVSAPLTDWFNPAVSVRALPPMV